MIKRVDRKKLNQMPIAHNSSGLYLCPRCWLPVAESVEGHATYAVFCKKCREHVLVKQ